MSFLPFGQIYSEIIYLFLGILLLVITIVHRIVFLISFSGKSLLTYRGGIDFYMLIFTFNNFVEFTFQS